MVAMILRLLEEWPIGSWMKPDPTTREGREEIKKIDEFLPIPWEPEDRDRILRYFSHVWPEAICEFVDYNEFFIFKDDKTKASWEESDATPENHDSMIHIIGTEQGITFVGDYKNRAMIDELITNLEVSRT